MSTENPKPDGLLRVSQAAKRMGVSPPTVYYLIKIKALPVIMITPDCKRIKSTDVDEYIARNTKGVDGGK